MIFNSQLFRILIIENFVLIMRNKNKERFLRHQKRLPCDDWENILDADKTINTTAKVKAKCFEKYSLPVAKRIDPVLFLRIFPNYTWMIILLEKKRRS